MSDASKELYTATRFGDTLRVKELLSTQGININYQGASGRTSLHLAAKKGHTEILKMLLKKGADCNVRNMKGLTPLEYVEDPAVRNIFVKYASAQADKIL